MDRSLSLPVQEFIRASGRVIVFDSNHRGLPEDDCEAVLFYAYELIRQIEQHCIERHHHQTLNKQAP